MCVCVCVLFPCRFMPILVPNPGDATDNGRKTAVVFVVIVDDSVYVERWINYFYLSNFCFLRVSIGILINHYRQ